MASIPKSASHPLMPQTPRTRGGSFHLFSSPSPSVSSPSSSSAPPSPSLRPSSGPPSPSSRHGANPIAEVLDNKNAVNNNAH